MQKKDKHNYRLIFAGKISHSKGVYELARAFSSIIEEKENCQLLIVGNASSEQKEKIIELAGHKHAIQFIPAQDQEHYAHYLQASDIYILPSYYEGLGLSSIEALACSCRAVVSENPNLEWLLGDWLVESGLVEFIDLPRLEQVDQPVAADLPAYINRISQAVLQQINRIEKQEKQQKGAWSAAVEEEIASLSWESIVDQFDSTARSLI